MSEVIDARAVPIDAPEAVTAPDAWLAQKRAEVERLAAEYTPFEVADADAYREAKRLRSGLRKEIAAIEGDRKQMTRAVEDAVRAFKDGAKGVLAPLTDAEQAYKDNIAAYEREVKAARAAELESYYESMWPDLSKQARWADLLAAYGEKWLLASTGAAKARDGVNEAADEVAGNLEAIAATRHGADILVAQADYLRDLDYSRFLRDEQQRVAKVEEVRRQEREAREWAARFHAEQQAAASEPEPRPEPAPEPVQVPEPAPEPDGGRVLVFEVEVPAGRVQEFIAAMRAIGAHGRKVGVKDAR